MLHHVLRTLLVHSGRRRFRGLALNLLEIMLGGTYCGVQLDGPEFLEPKEAGARSADAKQQGTRARREARFQVALQGFRRLLSWAIAERASFTWRILARGHPRPTVLRPDRRESNGSRQGTAGEPRHGPGGTSGAAADARMAGTGPTADTSPEAVLADKHDNYVSLSAKFMSMVRMEDSLLPAVFVDVTVQSDNPRGHGDRQDGQGTDEQPKAAPLENAAATG